MGSPSRSVWIKRAARVLLVLVATYVVLGLASFAVIYFLKGRAPPEIKRVVEPRLDALRAFTERVASRCPEVRSTGLMAQLQGTVPASPAVGTDLDRWPELVDVRVGCFWWVRPGDRTFATGNHFRLLRDAPTRPGGSSEGEWQISRGFFPGWQPEWSRESATWWQGDPNTVDVTIRRPLAGDAGYVDVMATLRRARRARARRPAR